MDGSYCIEIVKSKDCSVLVEHAFRPRSVMSVDLAKKLIVISSWSSK